MKLIAVCIFGIESVLSEELRELGYNLTEVSNGRISFEGGFADAAKCNIWLRTAERIYIETSEFRALDFDSLFEGVRNVDWQDYMPVNASVTVRASSINSRLFSTRDCQSVSKKAIMEKLGKSYGLELLPETGSDYTVEIFIHKDNASVCIDTTGTGLHKRGYRTWNVEAPLKETIAAALLRISYWNPGRILLDPFCGSGTFAIEAAMMAADIAPGTGRTFQFADWSNEYYKMVEQVRGEALANERKYIETSLTGSDISEKNIDICKKHAEKARVGEITAFRVSDFRNIHREGDYGVLISNPPYGLRLSDKKETRELYRDLGEKFSEFDTWSKYILTDDDDFEATCGIRADKRRKIYNGTIRCTFFQYFGPRPPKR